MNINFTKRALRRLQQIHAYIAKDNKAVAGQTIARIDQIILMLEKFPRLGREGRIDETFELSVAGLPYIVVYEIPNETDITILTVIHTSQQYPAID